MPIITLSSAATDIEYMFIGSAPVSAPLIIFLHEGLGSLATWGEWPAALCKAAGYRGLVYSRYGYGGSTVRPAHQPWPTNYLETEAREQLPALLGALGIDAAHDKPILLGHSDGGSIALLYAAAFPGLVAATIAVAAHLFTEPLGLTRIRQLQGGFVGSQLQRKLASVHAAGDQVFQGWAELWLSERFLQWDIRSCLAKTSCPILAIQGAQDEYGTLYQLEELARGAGNVRTAVLSGCGHFPHLHQREALTDAVLRFLWNGLA